MSSSASQPLLKCYTLFNNEKTYSETKTRIYFISSIWDDDQIMRLDENTWKCLWCNTSFQGINATEALARVLGKKGMHIYSFYVLKEKAHIKRHQELQKYEHAR